MKSSDDNTNNELDYTSYIMQKLSIGLSGRFFATRREMAMKMQYIEFFHQMRYYENKNGKKIKSYNLPSYIQERTSYPKGRFFRRKTLIFPLLDSTAAAPRINECRGYRPCNNRRVYINNRSFCAA